MSFANAADINRREDSKYLKEFGCKGLPVAYANTLVFQQGSLEFGSVTNAVVSSGSQ